MRRKPEKLVIAVRVGRCSGTWLSFFLSIDCFKIDARRRKEAFILIFFQLRIETYLKKIDCAKLMN